jgi:chromosome segregation ATPase
MAKLKVASKELNDKLVAKEKELSSKEEEHKSLVDDLNEKLSTGKKEYQLVRERLTSSEEENNSLMEKKAKLYQINMKKLEKEIKTIPDLHKQIEDLKSEINSKTQEKEGLVETNRILEEKIAKLPTTSAMEILTKQLSESISNNESLLSKITALSEENEAIVTLESDLAKAHRMIEYH